MNATSARLAARLNRELGDHSRPLFTLLRRLRPVIATRRFGVVTRADDVREVLADFAHFGVPAYNEKMMAISGPFILGLDDTPLYRHDHQALRAAIRREDSDRLAQRTLSTARDRLQMTEGQIDVVGQLADPTIDTVMSDYFGTPGPGTATQLRWARDIFTMSSSTSAAAPVRTTAHWPPRPRCGPTSTRRSQPAGALKAGRTVPPDDVLTRLMQHSSADGGLHDIAIRHNLIGLIAGWIPTVSKAFACAVDELLRRPKLSGAHRRRHVPATTPRSAPTSSRHCGSGPRRGRCCEPAKPTTRSPRNAARYTLSRRLKCSSRPSRLCSMAAAFARRGVPARPAVRELPALRPRPAHVLRAGDQPPPATGHGGRPVRGTAAATSARSSRPDDLRRPYPASLTVTRAGPTREHGRPDPIHLSAQPRQRVQPLRPAPLRDQRARGAPRPAHPVGRHPHSRGHASHPDAGGRRTEATGPDQAHHRPPRIDGATRA